MKEDIETYGGNTLTLEKPDEETLDFDSRLIVLMTASEPFMEKMQGAIIPENYNALGNRYMYRLTSWLLDYYQRYKVTPHENVYEYIQKRSKELRQEKDAKSVIENIEKLLETSFAKNQKDTDFAHEEILEYLQKQAAQVTAKQAQELLDDGKTNEAQKLIEEYKKPDMQEISGISIIADTDFAKHSLVASKEDIVFSCPGAFGKVLGEVRNTDFVAVLAPAKGGKTFFLQHIAISAYKCNKRVLVISCEMPKEELSRRYWSALTYRPIDMDYALFISNKRQRDGDCLRRIAFIDNDEYEETDTENKYSFVMKNLSHIRAPLGGKKIKRISHWLRTHYREGDIFLEAVPMGTLTFSKIRGFARYYNPDVIIVDYADIMYLRDNVDYRHSIDTVWKGLRGFAAETGIPVITGSQTNRNGAKGDTGVSSVAEDYRKIAHVTSMISVQKLDFNKEGLYGNAFGVASLVNRNQSYENCICCGALYLGQPCIESHFVSEIDTRVVLQKSFKNKTDTMKKKEVEK